MHLIVGSSWGSSCPRSHGFPFFRTPSCPRALPIDRPPSPAHNFSLYFQTVTIHPATDPFHAQGNLQTPPQPPVPARSGRPPSLLPSSSSTTRGWSSPISSVGVALLLRSAGASAINHGLSGSGGKRTGGDGPCGGAAAAGARERRRRARSLAPSRPASLQLVNRSPREKRRDRGSDCSIRMRSFRTASLRCGARDISA